MHIIKQTTEFISYIPFDGVVVFHDCGKLMAGKSGNVQTGIRLLENKNNYSIINSSS